MGNILLYSKNINGEMKLISIICTSKKGILKLLFTFHIINQYSNFVHVIKFYFESEIFLKIENILLFTCAVYVISILHISLPTIINFLWHSIHSQRCQLKSIRCYFVHIYVYVVRTSKIENFYGEKNNYSIFTNTCGMNYEEIFYCIYLCV